MGIDYADEKYMVAAHLMATGVGRIQDRLMSAVMSFHTLQQDDFPDPEMWTEHESIMEAFTTVRDDAHGRGYFQATLDRMPDEDGRELADRIWNLRSRIEDAVEEQRTKRRR